MMLSMPFALGGTMSAMFGFAVMTWLMNKRNMSGRKKSILGLGALIAALASGAFYTLLLLSPEHVTPSFGIELLEFILYCIAYLCVCAFLAHIYWHGGPQIYRMFFKIPVGN
jgi:hypothetical protein